MHGRQSEKLGQQGSGSLQFQESFQVDHQENSQENLQDVNVEDESLDLDNFIGEVGRIISEIRHIERKFCRAKKQIILLNNRIHQLVVRYYRAVDQGRMSFKFTMRSRCATLEGVRNMYFEYAKKQCLMMDALQDSLRVIAGEQYDLL